MIKKKRLKHSLLLFVMLHCVLSLSAQITLISSNAEEQWQITTKEWQKAQPSDQADIVIKPEQRFQTIEGWGACFNERGWKALQYLDQAKQDEIMNLLFSAEGCDFSYCRMPIGASDYALDYYSLDDTAGDYAMAHFSIERDRKYLLPYIKAAMTIKPDLKIWGSPWTPPAWMKDNGHYHQGKIIMDAKTLKAYALYFQKYVEAYRREGVNIVAIHPQNEPLHLPMFPSCGWRGEELKTFIKDYLGPRFVQYMPDCEIWLGTINGNAETDEYEEYINTVFSDEEAAKYIRGAGFQWDGDAAVEEMLGHYPDKKIMQTETKCGWGANDWKYAFETYQEMVWYLERNASIYQQWNMVLNETGMSSWGWKQNSMVTVDTYSKTYRINPQYWVVRHFTQYIKPGAQRLSCNIKDGEQALVFRNPDASLVLVCCNMNNEEQNISIALNEKMLNLRVLPQTIVTVRL